MTDQTTLTRCRLLLDGAWTEGQGPAAPVLDKYTLEPWAEIRTATDAQVTAAIDTADRAFRGGAPGSHQRGEILQRAAALVRANAEEFVRIMQAEAGFTRSDAQGEVTRCCETLRLSAEEARRLAGRVVPIEGAPGQARRLAFTLMVPLGVVLAVTPFNSPLNTVTHKIAPAFAAGNAVVLKPSSSTPVTAIRLAELLLEAGMPEGFLSILLGGAAVVGRAVADDRVRFVAFTGSTEVGRALQSSAGLRRTQMELGSIAFTIVADDADLDLALPGIVGAGYRKAGQVCTSVQMLLVQEAITATATDRLAQLVRAVRYGDPRAEGTVAGPLISEQDARRVEAWTAEAVAQGATRVVGGERRGSVVPPTLLAGVTPGMRVASCEIFGPVVCVSPYATLDEAIGRVNATPYGLATGVFTNRLGDALEAARRLHVGGVHINETSSSRVDLMPYGGSKDSGFGREGPAFAIREMSEERVVTISA